MSKRRQSKRINPYSTNRDDKGRFIKTCGAVNHATYVRSFETVQLLGIQSSKKISKAVKSKLIEKGIITNETIHICNECLLRGNVPMGNSSKNETKVEEEAKTEREKSILKFLQIGNELHEQITADVTNLYKLNGIMKNIDTLTKYNVTDWLSKRPPELLHFLSELCEIDINIASEKKLCVLSKIIELIYYCQNSKLIMPNHFLENLLSYSFTNCKSYSNFLGSRCPGGSYTYISSWLSDQTNSPILFPNGVVKAVFDNNQKIGRTHLITGNNIVPTSVMTSHIWLVLDQSMLQEDANLSPQRWMWSVTENDTLVKKCINFFTQSSSALRETRDKFLAACIDRVEEQLHKHSNVDDIDIHIQNQTLASMEKICITCGCEADPTFRICRNCGGKLMKPKQKNFDVKVPRLSVNANFNDFLSTCPKIECVTGEPDFVNPNSYQNIIQVLQNIGFRAGIEQYGGCRKWLIVE